MKGNKSDKLSISIQMAHCLASGNLIRFDAIFNSVFFVSDRFFEVSITYENI